MLDLRWVMWSIYCSQGKHICAIWRHGISIKSGDSYGHKLCFNQNGFVFILLSNLNKSKYYDLIDMFNDISVYLDNIFTIDNPVFE